MIRKDKTGCPECGRKSVASKRHQRAMVNGGLFERYPELLASWNYERNKDKLDNQWNIIKPIIVALIIVGLVMIQPDMGTAVIVGLITIIMFYGVPIDKKNRSIFNKIFIGGILLVDTSIAALLSTINMYFDDMDKYFAVRQQVSDYM